MTRRIRCTWAVPAWMTFTCILAVAADPAVPAAGGDYASLKQEAARLDREERWAESIGTYLEILERFPGSEKAAYAREQIELLAAMFLEQEAHLSDVAFAAMEPVLAKAADRRVFPAAMLLGTRLRETGHSREALHYFERAAASGYPPAMIQAGLMYSNGDGAPPDLEKASAWLRPANVKGSALGKYLLAECFLFGKGVPRNPAAAVGLLKEAARMEHPGRALDLLATCYHKGWGIEADPAEAVRLYASACDEGFHNAYANLGVLYMKGEGVERSPTKALRLFRDGAEEANGPCMYFYAAAHLEGLGVERDPAAARHWFRRAAEAGDARAIAWCEANQGGE